jgi:hypothetical protein
MEMGIQRLNTGRRRLQDGSHFTGREAVHRRSMDSAKTLRRNRFASAP